MNIEVAMMEVLISIIEQIGVQLNQMIADHLYFTDIFLGGLIINSTLANKVQLQWNLYQITTMSTQENAHFKMSTLILRLFSVSNEIRLIIS